jgi:tetratricopeptide (TPR) repeat protein
MKRRTLNLKFLACLLASIAVLSTGAHFLRAFQVKRNASTLLKLADREEQQGHIDKSLEYLDRFLTLEPGDANTLAKYGLMLQKAAKAPEARERAFRALDRVLVFKADRNDIRRLVVSLAIDLRRVSDARLHLDILQKAAPTDGTLKYLRGTCEELEGRWHEAKQWYVKAIDLFKKSGWHGPEQVECYARLAELLRRRLTQPQLAEATLNEMVVVCPSFRAFLARARYWRDRALQEHGVDGKTGRQKLLENADKDLVKAREAAPNDADVLLESFALARLQARYDAAGDFGRRCLELYPHDRRAYRAIAELEVSAGQPAKAIACLERGLKALPADIGLILSLADVLIQNNRLAEAGTLVQRLRTAKVQSAPVDYLEGHLLFRKGQWLAASRILERAAPRLERWPELAKQGTALLGRCYEQLGDIDHQWGAYRRLAKMEPSSPAALLGKAHALEALGKVDEAIDAYRQLLPRAPELKPVVARLLVRQNLALPRALRQWGCQQAPG